MKTTVFDLGGVLIDWNPRYLYKKIFASADEMEYFLSVVCPPAWNTLLDAGRPFAEALAEAKAKHPGYAAQIDAYGARWAEMLGGPVEGSVAVLREVKTKGGSIYALTNWSAETFPIAREKYDFLTWFDGILVSGEEKLAKPDPAIYKRLLDKFNLRAEDCVFIDDNSANVEAAEKLGFYGVHFSSPDLLRAELNRQQIL